MVVRLFYTDPTRGQVLQFSGNGYVDAGLLPQLTTSNDFTWSFWALNQTKPAVSPNATILGNRYSSPAATEFNPREYTRFTPTQFEFHRNGIGENSDYTDLQNPSEWVHLSVVKRADHLITYQNGILQGVSKITAGQSNPQPLYFGGNGLLEDWTGRMDDVALWNNALPNSSVVGLAKRTLTPTTAPLTGNLNPPGTQEAFYDNFFYGLENWTVTNRGSENNGPAGYNPPDTTGYGVSLSGTTMRQYWYGSSLESKARYSSSVYTAVQVVRASLSGSGTGYGSSIWVFGVDGHYLRLAQDVGWGGWVWNARDDGGLGTLNPTGSGNNIAELDYLDSALDSYAMNIAIVPTGTAGEVNMFILLGQLSCCRPRLYKLSNHFRNYSDRGGTRHGRFGECALRPREGIRSIGLCRRRNGRPIASSSALPLRSGSS
jgi:hypothetical protein